MPYSNANSTVRLNPSFTSTGSPKVANLLTLNRLLDQVPAVPERDNFFLSAESNVTPHIICSLW
jgi:hypothetical protein